MKCRTHDGLSLTFTVCNGGSPVLCCDCRVVQPVLVVLCCSARPPIPLHQGAEQQCYTSDLGALLQDGPASRLQAVLQKSPHSAVHRSLHLPSQCLPVHHHSAGWGPRSLSHSHDCVTRCLRNLDFVLIVISSLCLSHLIWAENRHRTSPTWKMKNLNLKNWINS